MKEVVHAPREAQLTCVALPQGCAALPAAATSAMGRPIAWSLELSTTSLLKAGSTVAPLLARIPGGTRIYLPALPTDPPSAITDALALLQRENAALVPVPHIAASRERSTAELERRLAEWQRASGSNVREALIVRGDPLATHSTDDGVAAASQGGARRANGAPFQTSIDLLETGVLQRCGLDAVSLCGHPEGVGGLSADAARAALMAKLAWADAAGVRARVVTQFCFDQPTTTAFVDALRADGADGVDVSLGIVGPDVRHAVCQRMAKRCGVAPPASPSAAPYLRSLASWQQQRGATAGAQALHLYPFAGLGATLSAMREFCGGGGALTDRSGRRATFDFEPPVPPPPYD